MSGYVDEDEARKIIAELRQRAESAERALAEARQECDKLRGTAAFLLCCVKCGEGITIDEEMEIRNTLALPAPPEPTTKEQP